MNSIRRRPTSKRRAPKVVIHITQARKGLSIRFHTMEVEDHIKRWAKSWLKARLADLLNGSWLDESPVEK